MYNIHFRGIKVIFIFLVGTVELLQTIAPARTKEHSRPGKIGVIPCQFNHKVESGVGDFFYFLRVNRARWEMLNVANWSSSSLFGGELRALKVLR